MWFVRSVVFGSNVACKVEFGDLMATKFGFKPY